MWRRATGILTILAGVLTALSPAASAAWTQAPAYAEPDAGPAACLRPAGVGRVALTGPIVDHGSTVDVLSVGGDGLAPLTQTALGSLQACAASGAAAGPDAVPLLAGITTGTPSLRGAQVSNGVRYPSQNAFDAASSVITASAGGPAATLTAPVLFLIHI